MTHPGCMNIQTPNTQISPAPNSSSPARTCVIEDGGADGAVLKHRVRGPDVLETTVFKQRVFELDRLHLDTDEPMGSGMDTKPKRRRRMDFYCRHRAEQM